MLRFSAARSVRRELILHVLARYEFDVAVDHPAVVLTKIITQRREESKLRDGFVRKLPMLVSDDVGYSCYQIKLAAKMSYLQSILSRLRPRCHDGTAMF